MTKIVIFCLIFVIIVFGILDIIMENYIEKAVLQGYPGTEKVDVDLHLNLLKKKENNLKIKIKDWDLDSWRLNYFMGEFNGVRINWYYLLLKKVFVVENIKQGKITAFIDNENLKKSIKRYYPGLESEILKEKLKLKLNLEILGKNIEAIVYGKLLPAKGTKIVFEPQELYINNYSLSKLSQINVLNKFKINLNLEKIPFTFQITTVKIMQDKIILEGKV